MQLHWLWRLLDAFVIAIVRHSRQLDTDLGFLDAVASAFAIVELCSVLHRDSGTQLPFTFAFLRRSFIWIRDRLTQLHSQLVSLSCARIRETQTQLHLHSQLLNAVGFVTSIFSLSCVRIHNLLASVAFALRPKLCSSGTFSQCLWSLVPKCCVPKRPTTMDGEYNPPGLKQAVGESSSRSVGSMPKNDNGVGTCRRARIDIANGTVIVVATGLCSCPLAAERGDSEEGVNACSISSIGLVGVGCGGVTMVRRIRHGSLTENATFLC